MRQTPIAILLFFYLPFIYAQQKDLDYYLQQAMKNSPLLQDYQNLVQSNRIDSMLIRAGKGIQVEALSTGTYAPVIQGWGYDQAITNIADISAALSLSKEITGRRNLQNQYNSLHYQNQSLLHTRKISALDLQKQVTSQYIDAFGDYLSLQSNNEVLHILQQQELVMKALTEQGIIKQTDYLALRVRLNQQEITVDQYHSQFVTDIAMLNLLCGIRDTSAQLLSDPYLEVDSLFDLRQTVFYQHFITDSMALDVQNRQIDFDYQPKLSLFADGGYHSSFALDPGKNVGASAGFSLTVPLYDGHQRTMQHDKISIAEQTRAGYSTFYSGQYYQQVNMLLQQLQSINKIRDKVVKQVEYSRTLIDADQKLVNSGEISVADYLLAISDWIDANRSLMENKISAYHIINELNYLSSQK
jgi:outer membrane protein TolC